LVILLTCSKHGRRNASDLRRPLEGGFLVPSAVNDPGHWRRRAKEMRALADDMKDEKSKQRMFRIADDYERLAKRAEERAKRPPQSK
jgi:hypothetical protein